ncbi:MAG: hydrogenase expression/formation protein HypE [Candidatus Methylomirabilales bacterium]
MSRPEELAPACPIPFSGSDRILLAHGGGGRLMHDLLEGLILPAFGSAELLARHDGAVLDLAGARLAFTTDGYVVRPLRFPGGDIGRLAVNGTVNDLAMCGARPLVLSVSFILEEGLPLATFTEILASMHASAEAAGVRIVTGDTKVVDRGKGDGIFVTTAGVGLVEHRLGIAPSRVRPGDAILVSGDLGRHGVAIMAAREELQFETPVESDCAPLHGLVGALLGAGLEIHCLRDCTRGGLAASLVEIAAAAALPLLVREADIPVQEAVQGACEMLGLDPLYVANEGRFVCFLPEAQAARALEVLRAEPLGAGAARIGEVAGDLPGVVSLISRIGAARIMDLPSGEQLPRIC